MELYNFSDFHVELFECNNRRSKKREQTKSNWSTNKTARKLIQLQDVVSPTSPFSW